MMKILQVSNSFKYAWESGGVTRAVYELSKHLVERGHEVTVFATEKGLPKHSNIRRNSPVTIDGIEVYYFRNLSNYLAKRAISVPYFAPLVVKKRLNEFDVIHLHEYRRVIVPIIHHYAKKYRTPYILQAHGSLSTYFHKGNLKRIFDRLWGYRILREASKVIALTETEAKQYKSIGVSEDKIGIVPLGIDLSEFDNLPKRGEFRRRYGLNSNQRMILYLGRIHKIKGLDLLLKAFAGLLKHFDDAKLVIAGPDHGYLPALERLIKELDMKKRVLFTGPLYEKEKLGAYVDANVYILPSSYEIFGLTILEAMACGTPVIVTDRCGIADVIDGQAGLAVPYDERQLQETLQRILGDDKMSQGFGERGRSLVREKFNWEKIAQQVENIYRDIL